MIRNRLSFAFALLALIAILQCVFVYWSTREAARAAERSVVATNLLNHYLELGANKQRLKVWLAELTITGGSTVASRDLLIKRMSDSLASLRSLSARNIELGAQGASLEQSTVADLVASFSALKQSLLTLSAVAQKTAPAQGWATMIDTFDRFEGTDMREVLQAAVMRQRSAALSAERELNLALATTRQISVALAITAFLLGGFAVFYFVRQLQRPFAAVLQATDDIAADQHKSMPAALSNRRDEFGRIGQHLQSMAAKLASAKRDNETIRAGLDATVAARTEELTRSHGELMRLDSRRRHFFADISHELRTPVTVIRGEAEVALRRVQTDAEYRATLARIVETAEGLGIRVQELLALASADAEHHVVVLSPLSISSVVRQAVLSMQAIASNRRILLTQIISPEADEVVVATDRDKLMQVLVIVLDNAIRYSTAGTTVSVEIQCVDDQVFIIITDEGMGITENECEHAFERHYRGPTASRTRPDGAGLGLSIARDIIDQHHGLINIVSASTIKVAGGARVTIELPRHTDRPLNEASAA